MDPGLGGGALKKIAPSGGRRENFWGISCEKSRFYAKNLIFSNFRGGGGGGGGAPGAPPGSAPAIIYLNHVSNTDSLSEWLLFNDNFSNFSALSIYQVNFQWDDDEVRFVLDQHS